MRRSAFCAILFAVGLAAQAGDEARMRDDLTTALMAINSPDQDARAKTDRLIASLSAVPEAAHRPSRAAVVRLAREMVLRLSGRSLSRPRVAQIAADIVVALRGAGMGAADYKDAITRFEKALSGLGAPSVGVRSAGEKLRAAGDEVRGPQDLPVSQD